MDDQTRDRFSQMNRMIDSGWALAYARGYHTGRTGEDAHKYTDDRAFWYSMGVKQGVVDRMNPPNSVSEETSDGI